MNLEERYISNYRAYSWALHPHPIYLANDFAFMHELNFQKIMINRYLLDTRNNIEPLYPLEFIEQYGSNTKIFMMTYLR